MAKEIHPHRSRRHRTRDVDPPADDQGEREALEAEAARTAARARRSEPRDVTGRT